MQKDFHYYATYCAAFLAGWSHEESMDICYSAQFVDLCTKTFLKGLKAPVAAATTQLQLELADTRMDLQGIQEMTRIWSSFHFLPRDLYADPGRKVSRSYLNKYRLICGPNGKLLAETVRLAKDHGLQAAGIAMHVLADTWAHQYFAGTPSLAVNNTNDYFYEIVQADDEPGGFKNVPIRFIHSTSKPDDPEHSVYVNSLYQGSERSIMNLGHGRAGHLPDYSFIRYRYLPAWGDYIEIVKDNPHDYVCAFAQMIYALRYLRGAEESFETDRYSVHAMMPWKDEILSIINTRQTDSCDDWKALGEKLSGQEIPDFELDRYRSEYIAAGSDEEKDATFLGQFITAALAQKSMVTAMIYRSGSKLAGISVDYREKGFRGMKDYSALLRRKSASDLQGLADSVAEGVDMIIDQAASDTDFSGLTLNDRGGSDE